MTRLPLALLILLSPCSAFATTYVFTASNYNIGVSGPVYTAAMHASGTFTTAQPLGANLANVDITNPASGNSLLDWNFSDGAHTYSRANSTINPHPVSGGLVGGFNLSTDSAGNPTSLYAVLINPTAPYAEGQTVDFLMIYVPQNVSTIANAICLVPNDGICMSFDPGPQITSAFPLTFSIARQNDPAIVGAPAGNVYGWLGLVIALVVSAWGYLAAATMSFGRPEFRSKN